MAAPGYNYNQQGGYPPMQPGYQPQPQPGYQPGPSPNAFPAEAQAQPSAPTFETVSGYEAASGLNNVAAGPPPAFVPQGQPAERPSEQFDQAAAITDTQAQDALKSFVAENCCFGKSPAEDVIVKEMISSSAYHYKLESFTEERNFKWHHEPYHGQPIDGPQNGPAPPPWSIPVQHPPPFQENEFFLEIPHTARVKKCHMCHGKGTIKCHNCHGKGKTPCTSCNGEGEKDVQGQRVECVYCSGHGHNNCAVCNGSKKVTCNVCNGTGKLKNYLRLSVKWSVRVGEHVIERSDLPDELVKHVSGLEIFRQEFPRVFPLTSFFEQEINGASQRICYEHDAFTKTMILHRQRHSLRAVPVNEVHGVWKEKMYRFWVYGMEHKVHCPDYPQQCCCGCVIL